MEKFNFFTCIKCKSVSFLALVFVFSMAFAQSPYTIQFQDEIKVMPENIDTFEWNQMPATAVLEGGYIGWVQFYETPNQTVQDRFRDNNLRLIEYIPYRTYLFYFPASTSVSFLRNNGVRSIVPVENRFKLEQNLKNGNIGDWALLGDHYRVTLQHHDMVSTDFVINDLASQQIAVEQRYTTSNNIDLIIPDNCLDNLASLPYVKWVEVIAAPSIPDDQEGKSLHRSQNLDTQTSSGRNYDGSGVGVLCRDDGAVGPHIDFQGRINGLVGANGQGHGDGVSGIMAGSGNLDPTKRGMAAGSELHVVNYNSSFLDNPTVSLIASGDVQITNSSYSNGCNAGYTTAAQTVDTQLQDNPNLMHVFSAGNSNGSNCGYGAGSQWGNITGGHKQGKNVLTTANVLYNGFIVNSSSRGPAHDGRIKPDISAYGNFQQSTNQNNTYQSFSGTSAASPGIAGVSAQLYQVYMDENGGDFPPNALIKATLLNTANDAGNVGPDFKYGWGIVNALRAGILIEDGRYLSSNVSQGNTNTHSINVPAGTTQLRVMVHWSDRPATVGANPALVNDLDLVVNDPSNVDHLPWILDSTPNATALDTPATNGIDHLNNVEQVLINNPATGSYDVEITGFDVPMGPQEYFVVYEFISENVKVTYPNHGEKFYPIETQTIHWDAVNTTSDFTLEYSLDNGSSWNFIETVGPTVRNFDWNVPNETSSQALIRVTSGGFQDVSDNPFIIARFPSGITVESVCPTEATFEWFEVDGAEFYDLWTLGDQYMEVVGTSTTNSITIPITDPNDAIWFAVSARNDTDGWESRRSRAIFYSGGLNCTLSVEDNVISQVALYPNPATNAVTVSLPISFERLSIAVTNSLGQKLQTLDESHFNGGTEATINVSGLRTGVYFVTIEADGQNTTKKLLVN